MTYYWERHGQGQPMLMLHGFTGSTQNWAGQIPLLASHYELFLVDLPAHGKTIVYDELQAYSMPTVAQNLANLIQTIYQEPIFILGYSMGGRLALYLAIHYPHLVKYLILESSSAGLKTAAERHARQTQDEQLAEQIEANGIEWFVDYWENLPLFFTQKKSAELRTLRLKNSPRGLAQSLRGMGTGVQPSLWEVLPTLVCPVALVVGELDEKFCQINRQMQTLLPNSKLEIVPQAGHTVHLEQPTAYSKYLLGLLG